MSFDSIMYMLIDFVFLNLKELNEVFCRKKLSFLNCKIGIRGDNVKCLSEL